MATYVESPEPQWFERTETKCRCGKRATGILRGRQNQSFGPHCEPCANKRIAAAKRVRDQIAKAAADA
jgi:hydrogenase maturation factor